MKRVFIIHGYTGYPDKNWFPWLRAESEKLGMEVTVLAMPNTNLPVLEEWLTYLHQTISKPDEETYLIGHSLGCPAILRYLESLDDGEAIGGVVLVAGFAEPLLGLPQLDSFTAGIWDDEKIKSHAKQIVIINSDDDEAVPFLNGEHVRDRFDAELITVHGMGHINEKAGVTEAPFVLDKLKIMLEL